MKCNHGSRFEKGANGVRRFWLVYPLSPIELAELDITLASFVPGNAPPGSEEVWRAITRERGGACAIVLHLRSGPLPSRGDAAGLN